MKTVAILSDLHMPFHCKISLQKAIAIVEQKRPQVIIVNGDLFDAYSFSKFPRNVNLYTPAEEMRQARYYAEKMFSDLRKASPRAKMFLTLGNHSMRISKRLAESLPELVGIVDITHLWKFPGVETIWDPREPLEIDDALYVHGWFTKLGDTVKYFHKNVFVGHSHRPGIFYHRLGGKTIYECNSGMLANINSIPLSYTPSKITTATTAMAFKDDMGPRVYLL